MITQLEREGFPVAVVCQALGVSRAGYYAQCDHANPNGPQAGTAFYGGPKNSGPFHGMQAERVRVPFANVNLVKVPEGVSDDQAILISDIFPTGYFGADIADICDGRTVAVFGCGPVGQFTIAGAKKRLKESEEKDGFSLLNSQQSDYRQVLRAIREDLFALYELLNEKPR